MKSIRCFALLLGLLTPAAALAQWNQFQGNAAHTGYAPSAIHAPSINQIWSVAGVNVWDGGVAIVEGDVYTTMQGSPSVYADYHVRRFDGANGDLLWQSTIAGSSSSGVSAPTVSQNRVYVHHFGHSGSSGSSYPDDFPAMVGLDRNTGDQLFWTTHSGQWSSGSRPTLSGDAVFAAGGYYGGLDAYELNGTSRWFHKVNQQYDWTPAADENSVYVYMGEASASPGPSTGSLFIVDRATGTRQATVLHPNSNGTYYGDRQNVVLGGADDALAQSPDILVSFDISDRSIAWEREGRFSGNLAVANGMIVIPDGDVLRALDQQTGESLWTWSSKAVSGNVVLTDRYAFVNANKSVHAIDLQTQTSVWNSGAVTGELALDQNLLVISNRQGVYAYSSSLELPPELTTNPGHEQTLDFGRVRVGQSQTLALTVENTGPNGTTLSGVFPAAAGPFAPQASTNFGPLLATDAPASRDYTFAPTERGLTALPVTVASNGGDSTVTLQGLALGPVFSSSEGRGGLLDFGPVLLGTTRQVLLTLTNLSPDDNQGDHSLTDLTITDIQITGLDALLFSQSSASLLGGTLSIDELLQLAIDFHPDSPGRKTAQLAIWTDEGAALGGAGAVFTFDLVGSGALDAEAPVPEPSSFVLLGLGAVALLAAQRRRRRHTRRSAR